MTAAAGKPPPPGLPFTLGLIALGGAAGALTRYANGLIWPHAADEFPMGDFVSNLAGCLAMGLFLGVVSMLASTPARLTPLIATGYLGGLTTFSSYAADAAGLVDAGQVPKALFYVVATVFFGWLLLRSGWELGRRGASPKVGRPEFGAQEMGD